MKVIHENIFKELPDRFHAKTQQTLKQLGQYRKEYESCFTLTFMKKDDNATFAAVLGGGAADFNVFDDCGNFMLVDCDNISQCSDYESNYNFGVIIGFIIGGLMALCVIIFAPQILNKD